MSARPNIFERQHLQVEGGVLDYEMTQLRRFNEVLLRHLPLGVVVIDRAYKIVTTNGAARCLLGTREITAAQDFLHTVRGLPYLPVRNAIDTVFREQSSMTLQELEIENSTGASKRYVTLTITVIQSEQGAPEMAALSVMDATEQVQTRRRLEAVQAEQAQLVEELSASNARFSDMNKELQDSNEELQAANEELMLTQEELQTTNEELQATNEELQTTNDELTARTNELQELTREIASERKLLAEMVENSPFLIMLLKGPGLQVSAFNSGYVSLFNSRHVIGRPFEEVFMGSEMPDFIRLVREAYEQDSLRRTPRMHTRAPNSDGEPTDGYFIHTIVPVHDAAGKVDGVVIYTEDVTEPPKEESREG